jgi:hypothetical protein
MAKGASKHICIEQIFNCSTLPWRELVLKGKSPTIAAFIVCHYDWLILYMLAKYTLVAA